MLAHFALFATLMAPAAGESDPPSEKPPPATVTDLKPVAVSVVDGASGAPVTEFTYQAWYDAPGRRSPPNRDVWTRVVSPAGTFEIRTPPGCRLTIAAKAPDYIGGYSSFHHFVIKSTDNPRRAVVRLRRGITVMGTIRDSKTKNPMAGATVAPLIYKVPLRTPDEDKLVKTGADGRYEVRGVDPERGVSARHPDYVDDHTFHDGKTTGPNEDIFLVRKRRVTIAVTVVDSSGGPLEGVTAYELMGKPVASDKDERLVLHNLEVPVSPTFY
jgi:hypothetical protein